MPILGYLGFLPFALECAVMYEFLTLIDDRLSGAARVFFYLTQLAFWLMLFAALDLRTVLSFGPETVPATPAKILLIWAFLPGPLG
jgi:hypothetical protein